MIYLLRHGLDDERFIGGHSNVPLTEEGIQEVEKATEFIIESDLKINKIYTSDITRAVQTAEIINKRLSLQIIKKEYLRELDKGDLTGKSREYVEENYKEYIGLKDINIKYPNGESMIEFYQRIKNSLETILKEDNVLIITHRGVINMIYFILNDEYPTLDKEKFNVTHASIHEYNPDLKLIRKIY